MADTPIKGTPVVRVPQGYDFTKAKFTIDVPMNDQNGDFIAMESLYVDLETDALLDKPQLNKFDEVAKILYKVTDKIV